MQNYHIFFTTSCAQNHSNLQKLWIPQTSLTGYEKISKVSVAGVEELWHQQGVFASCETYCTRLLYFTLLPGNERCPSACQYDGMFVQSTPVAYLFRIPWRDEVQGAGGAVGCLPPTGGERGLDRVLCLSQNFFLIFGSKWAVFRSKKFCIQAKEGWGHCPVTSPKYATGTSVD